MNRNTILDQLRERPIPEYDDFMWMRGYKPYEILEAAEKSMFSEIQKREEAKKQKQEQKQEQQQSDVPLNVKLNVSVKKI